MHLLAAQQAGLDQSQEPVDLGQSPAECIVLSSADSELAGFAIASRDNRSLSLRLANLRYLAHPFSVDLYIEKTCAQAKIVIIRLLGGKSYWSYGVEQLADWAGQQGRIVMFLPGDATPDAELRALSSIQDRRYDQLWQYCIHGGAENASLALDACAILSAATDAPLPDALPIAECGFYQAGVTLPLSALDQKSSSTLPYRGVLLFYRALIQAADTTVIDAMTTGYARQGIEVIPIFVSSLKSPAIAAEVRTALLALKPDIILNTMGFALSKPGEGLANTALAQIRVPVLQVLFASLGLEDWHASSQGLGASDLAMQVALPELDGKVLTRAVSFKGVTLEAPWAEYQIIGHQPRHDRIAFCAELAQRWIRLARKSNADKNIAIILAHYPNKNARMGNGVGLDTPASIIGLLSNMRAAGYAIPDMPFHDGNGLIRHLQAGVNTVNSEIGETRETLSFADYQAFFVDLPETVQDAIQQQWGAPEEDPFFRNDRQVFALGLFRIGNICIGLQPARGYQINPQDSYHDPALVPPHGYLAFYCWLRTCFDVDALVQFGKHGNLEWLPGKALALSKACYPEVLHGTIPSLYPFIVNDPGEGTQAKRRTSSVIVDHLMPALTRAGNEGELGQLELLVDEYFQAGQTDPRRQKPLKAQILSLIEQWGIAEECGIAKHDDTTARLAKLDGYLCELKELQIRDGLHIFGVLAEGQSRYDLLVSLLRLKRGDAPEQASILQALAQDFELEANFDPLNIDTLGQPYHHALPVALSQASVRLCGDVRDALEVYAADMIAGIAPAVGPGSQAVLDYADKTLLPLLQESVQQETHQLLAALEGRYIPAGASGAPSRNRLDVLPTGRNFFSVDSRALPTPAAWQLGWKSANQLLERHAQDHGDYPKTLAMSAWGTANMRTGGDDIAQVLALLGARPTWQTATGRVTGIEILPLSVLGRPRVDVTLRISGFFRDAFPAQIALIDQAVRTVAALDEPSAMNPLAVAFQSEKQTLLAAGVSEQDADNRAGGRIYGAQPEAYGAGLQALMDSGVWSERKDLADAFIRWGGFRYGAKESGTEDFAGLSQRLQQTEVVSHNQDNREHDLLDSDDYYQFQGGLTAAVATLSGTEPVVYHNDHSQPDRPKTRLLSEELARVVWARVCNPKWQRGMMRHGYKGAFEMTASIDYLFSYAATTHLVSDALFDSVARAYLDHTEVCDFLHAHNPDALVDIATRLNEAIQRGLWQPRSNHHGMRIAEILSRPL